MKFLPLLFILFLGACAVPDVEKPPLVLKAASFRDLDGWYQDNQSEALVAFKRSCARILKNSPTTKFGSLDQAGTYGDWHAPCRDIMAMDGISGQTLRGYLERNFKPYEVRAGKEKEGLFTGYYEASLKGSKTRHGAYQQPLYKRPKDLIMVDLGAFRNDLKGRRIAGRVNGGKLKPYEDRTAIEAGKWPHNDKVLVWVDDPVDAFFLHIQGSGIVQLDDGQTMRVGYAGQNGHPYYAIGRELVKLGYLKKEEVSLQLIRKWLAQNSNQAAEIMNTNASYVFFHDLKGDGPLGGEGVALTPERSLAVDRSLISYGMPVWLDTEPPKEGTDPLQRLMIAQDTGGAIRGPVRGDVFWGYGDHAQVMAGHMKSKGRYWVLLPKNLSIN